MTEMHASMQRLYEAAARLPTPIRGQSALGRALGHSPQTIKNWENRPTGVSAAGASKAQQTLGISSTWILEGQEPMFIGEQAQPHSPSQSAGLQRKIIATVVRLIDYVEDLVLEPIPDADMERLIDVATAEVMAHWQSGISDQELPLAGRSVITRFRTGG